MYRNLKLQVHVKKKELFKVGLIHTRRQPWSIRARECCKQGERLLALVFEVYSALSVFSDLSEMFELKFTKKAINFSKLGARGEIETT